MTTKVKLSRLYPALEVLKNIQQHHPTAIIAGGAVRDLLMGKNIKDIDIFIHDRSFMTSAQQKSADILRPGDDHTSVEYWRKLIKLNSQDQSKKPTRRYVPHAKYDYITKSWSSSASKDNEFVSRIFKARKQGVEYDLIQLTIPPIEYVNRKFDIGFCKAYCDGYKIRYTTDFLDDRENNTLTVLGENMSIDEITYCLRVHVRNLQQKYPNFRVVLSPHNQKVVDLSLQS